MRHDNDTDTAAESPGSVKAMRNLRRYKVADGDPDVRGWEVVGADGERIGRVNDLLVDTAAGKVRYLDIRLDPSLYRRGNPSGLNVPSQEIEATGIPELDPLAGPGTGVIGHVTIPGAEPTPVGTSSLKEYLIRESLSETENRMTADHHLGSRHRSGDRHVVFPIGRARIDQEQDRVILEGQRAEDAVDLPACLPGDMDPDYERSLRQWFDPAYIPTEGRDLYAHELYDHDRFYGGARGSRAASEEEAPLPLRGR